MSDSGPNARARIVLPPGAVAEDFLAGLPDVVADVLRTTCDLVEDAGRTGSAAAETDPRVTSALDGLGEGVAWSWARARSSG